MKSFKTSRKFVGSPISFRALAMLEKRVLPFKIRDIIASDSIRHFNGNINTGTVGCQWRMTISQNGFWFTEADFHDGGVFTGDRAVITFLVDRTHSVGTQLGVQLPNPLTSGHRASASANGSDPWIRDNWSKLESSGPTVSLEAHPSLSDFGIVSIIGLALVSAAIVGLVSAGGGPGDSAEQPSLFATPCSEQQQRDSTCISVGSGPMKP